MICAVSVPPADRKRPGRHVTSSVRTPASVQPSSRPDRQQGGNDRLGGAQHWCAGETATSLIQWAACPDEYSVPRRDTVLDVDGQMT